MQGDIIRDGKNQKTVNLWDVKVNLAGMRVGSGYDYHVGFVSRDGSVLYRITMTMSEKEFTDFVDQLARHRDQLKEDLK